MFGVTVSGVTEDPSVDASAIEAVAVLSDDLRQRMYAFIRRAGRPVTRDEAAESVGISRKLAAFHLDKLVAVGLLSASYAQPSGLRRAGRAPKVYEPADVNVQVSIPRREHGLLAGLLLDAVQRQEPAESGRDAAVRVAGERGRSLGEDARHGGGRIGAERALTRAGEMLERHGFEPARVSPDRMRLRNCPFHPLAAENPDLVCAINQAFIAGFLSGLGADTVDAVLVPQPGACCVELGAPDPTGA